MHGLPGLSFSLINLSRPNVKLKINALIERRIKWGQRERKRASEAIEGKGRWNELSFIVIDGKKPEPREIKKLS